LPQPKQKSSTKKPGVRGDATAKPAAAAAPAKSTKRAVAKKAAPAKRAAAKAAPKPRATTPAAASKPKAAAPKKKIAAKRTGTTAKASRPAVKPAPAPEPTSAAARDEALRANLASLRDLLAGGVVLSAQRLQDAIDEAVTRGRMTRHDAEDLATGLMSAGRQQTADLVAELEQLLEKGRSDLTTAGAITKGAVDKARRAAGLGKK
jgi:polyhydroxyalkanoate synthesis regulator phasin